MLLSRTGDQHPVLTAVRDHLRTSRLRTPDDVWAPDNTPAEVAGHAAPDRIHRLLNRIDAWLSGTSHARTRVSHFGYSPDLNPVEGVWAYVKRSLAIFAVVALDRLEVLVRNRLKRLQDRPDTLDGFVAGTGLALDHPASP
ncbi:hypothetical protein [Streptomyces sp. NPDC056255]|uniref:hypothetical protein n=1 Tax=Streptomyces sp. NPDC056255 TaxID=3345764 RepID=UPI0035D6A625